MTLGAQPYCGKSGFDRVGGPQMNPVLGGIAVELQQRIKVAGDLGDRLGVLDAEVDLEGLDRELVLGDVFGVADVLDRR